MRTILAGLRVLREAPLAIAPLSIEGLVAAVLMLAGAFPGGGAAAASSAVFPLDVFFDVKQALAYGRGWPWFAAAMALSVLVRSGVLAATLWLRDGARTSLAGAWAGALGLAALAVAAMVPSAALLFLGVALRYAPFVWLGALAGVVPAIYLTRRAAALDTGAGSPGGRGVPEIGTFLGYAFFVTALAAAMAVLGGTGRWASALLLACSGPLHALYLLGWRGHLEEETYPAGGTLAVTVTVVGVVGLFGAAVFDRYVREPAPVARTRTGGTLLLLGGVDSTSTTGALSEIDPRDFGFDERDAAVLSYTGEGRRYGRADTHRDLERVAEVVAAQISGAPGEAFLLGHSQAAGIVDRILRAGPGPEASVILAPPPSRPPPVELPRPGARGPGKPGTDLARVLAEVFAALGLGPIEVDAPAAPPRLRTVTVADTATRRLAVWALGDSVWLQGDWRREGEVNVVAISDHVGVTNDVRAVDAARRFFAGQRVESDEATWRGALAAALRYAFEPWRPR
ncbi:MAG: hypothetical protein M3273_07975 [Actinomycetota bacterium]|nr:hypothetical protein [Actinomycetota bacterium]